jgi:hypothetical protein
VSQYPGPAYLRATTCLHATVGGVGKSALALRFIEDVFVDGYDPTIEGEEKRSL